MQICFFWLFRVTLETGGTVPLTEKQNGCLRSGRLREVVAMRELTVYLVKTAMKTKTKKTEKPISKTPKSPF